MSSLSDRLTAPRVVATVGDHNQLLDVIRRRVEELNVSHEVVEAIAGLQSGYLSKVLADPPPKRMGPFTWFLILGALGLDVQLAENQQAMERLRPRLEKRKLVRKRIRAKEGIIELTPDFRHRRSQLGGLARAKLPNISEINRRAALARWRRYREAQQTAER